MDTMKLRQDIGREVEKDSEAMASFMQDLIRIPGESGQEKEVILRIKEEMEKTGFDEVMIDGMGNILGRIGSGSRVMAYDAHIDTVGVGNREEWRWDPFEGKREGEMIFGRGATDQLSGMVSMVYAAKAIKTLNLHHDWTLYFVGSVQEEDCDGLCWQYILNEVGIKPELVVITEPTNLNIYRGHRGRMEMKAVVEGTSCHASAPERGDNPLYRAAGILQGIEALNEKIKEDPFLGKGTIAATHILNETPSLNAVPSRTEIFLDRRLTAGEDKELAIQQVEDIIKAKGLRAGVEMLHYNTPSYTGLVYPTEKYYPTWVVEEDHPIIKSAVSAFEDLFSQQPLVDKWTFSTNAVAIMGLHGIPCVGFGPSNEIHAHTVQEQVSLEHLKKACAFYTAYPFYLEK